MRIFQINLNKINEWLTCGTMSLDDKPCWCIYLRGTDWLLVACTFSFFFQPKSHTITFFLCLNLFIVSEFFCLNFSNKKPYRIWVSTRDDNPMFSDFFLSLADKMAPFNLQTKWKEQQKNQIKGFLQVIDFNYLQMIQRCSCNGYIIPLLIVILQVL